MPFPGLTRLSPQELFTDVIWNELMDLLEAKFSGSVGGGDIQWPFIVQGDIDFGGTYTILNLAQLWGIINADEYPEPKLENAIAEAVSNTGGLVLIPPDTTMTANNVSINSNNIAVVGCGPSSVVQITAASTDPLFTTDAVGRSGIVFANLTLDGTGGGSGCQAIRARRITRLTIDKVYITGFSGDFIVLTNGGVAGESCSDVRITNTYCSLGSDSHLFADDISGLFISNFISRNATGNAIEIVPASSSHLAQDIVVSNSHFATGGAKAIRIVGTGAPAIDAHSRISICNNRAVSMTGAPFELGGTSTMLKEVTVSDNTAAAAVGDALRIGATGGTVTGNHFKGASGGGDGIDMTGSVDLWVSGNNCQDASAYGIDATSSVDCTVVNNNLRDAVTDGINRTSSTGLRAGNNVGDDGPSLSNTLVDFTSYPQAGTGSVGFSHTIPAGSVRSGDVIRISAHVVSTSTSTTELRFGATALGSFVNDTNTAQVTWLIRVVQGGASSVRVVREQNTGPTFNTANTSATVDWSADQAMTFNVTANAGTVTFSGIFLELLGSK